MNVVGHVLALGAVCWIATCILVDFEVFRPLRNWLEMKEHMWTTIWADGDSYDPPVHIRWDRTREVGWRKASYLVSCHLCAGTWVALVLAALSPLHYFRPGILGWLLSGLLIKAVGHLILIGQKAGEAVSR